MRRRTDGTYEYTLPDRSSRIFNSTGRLLEVRDRSRNAITLTYDASGRLATATDPGGRTFEFSYDGDDHVTSVTGPAGQKVLYTYDGGELRTVRYDGEAGPLWQFGYDSQHQMTSMTDARGGTTTTEYDSQRRAVAQTDALNRRRTWVYDGDVTRITNPAGDVTRIRFADTRPLSITRGFGTPEASTVTYAYDADRNPVKRIDGNGHETTTTYDAKGNRTSVEDAEGRTTRWTYDANRQVTSITKPSGRKTTIDYDADGHPTKVSRTLVRPGQADQVEATSFTYDTRGLVTKMTDPRGKEWSHGYDAAGNRTSTTSPEGRKTTSTFDAASRLLTQTSGRGNASGANPADFTTTVTRDGRGRPTTIEDANGKTTTMAYDANDNRTTVTDPDGVSLQTTFDAENQPVRQTRADGSYQVTAYDADGNVTGFIDGRGKTTRYEWDSAGRKTATIDPLGRRTGLTYDAAGNVTVATDPAGRTAAYSYDDAGVLQGVDFSDPDTHDIGFSYDADGQRTGMTDETGTSSFEYDSLGRMTRAVDGGARTVEYTYDISSNPTGIKYPNGQTVSRTFDDDRLMTGVTDWLNHTTTFSYDPDGRLSKTEFPGGSSLADRVSRDNEGGPLAIAFGDQAGSLGKLDYGRTDGGRVASEQAQNMPGGTTAFDYDQNGRLSLAGTDTFSYNAADGITKLAGLEPLVYDDAGQLTVSNSGANERSFSFDSLGARTGESGAGQPARSYGYDQRQLLTSAGETGQPTVEYESDADGLRARRSVGSAARAFTWDRTTSSLPLMLTEGGTSYIYGPDGLAVEHVDGNGDVAFYHHDQLGSTRRLTDATGAVVAGFTYDAYGTVVTQTGTADTPLRFAGEYSDAASGLVYLRARHYDPRTGQFLTPDPLGALTKDPYAYAGNDPLNHADPSGLFLGMGHVPVIDDITEGVKDATVGAVKFAWEHPVFTMNVVAGVTCVVGSFASCAKLAMAAFAVFEVESGVAAVYNTRRRCKTFAQETLGNVAGLLAGMIPAVRLERVAPVNWPKAIEVGHDSATGLLGTGASGAASPDRPWSGDGCC
ncbi:hypothetical protein PAI11_44530 [Patulibacter medicamentivorans]|uniref:Teneurin-like YD-shell domain-containing protein n=1 Tax=Patulibacter medicamentivorans TaxID=1097667 RepID=H0EC54_9ACTN|nr:hypothetical protein PAI11_44530 [Patulibacter medicamentivorans]